MENLRDIHWEIHLVQMLDLREAPLLECKVVRVLEKLRDLHW